MSLTVKVEATVNMLLDEGAMYPLSGCEVVGYSYPEKVLRDGVYDQLSECMSWAYPRGLIEEMYELGHKDGEFKVTTEITFTYYEDYYGEVDVDISYDNMEVVEL